MSLDELARRQVPGHRLATERVADHQIGAAGRHVAQVDPGIAGGDVQMVVDHQTQVVLGDVDQRGVELEHGVLRAGPRGRQVARHREPAAADVHGVDRLRPSARSPR